MSLVFVGRKPYADDRRLLLATPEAINLQGARVANNDEKRAQQMRTHGTRKQGQQKSIVEAKTAPKTDPGGFQKRVRKTAGN